MNFKQGAFEKIESTRSTAILSIVSHHAPLSTALSLANTPDRFPGRAALDGVWSLNMMDGPNPHPAGQNKNKQRCFSARM